MGKGVAVFVGSKRGAIGCDSYKIDRLGFDKGDEDEDEGEWRKDFKGPAPRKKQKCSVTGRDSGVLVQKVVPPDDLLFGTAPTKVEKALAKAKQKKKPATSGTTTKEKRVVKGHVTLTAQLVEPSANIECFDNQEHGLGRQTRVAK